MVQKFDKPILTPSQTAGPYVHIGLAPEAGGIEGAPFETLGREIAGPEAKGERIKVTCRVVDGGDLPLRDCLVETWQADAAGIYPGQEGADPAVSGFGRIPADFSTGEIIFETIKPGAIALSGDRETPPHISFWIFARGINHGLHTRMYFPEDDLSGDPLLARIEHRDRIATMVAEATGPGEYRFDIRLQGAGETVFFDI
ncbi:protocatechuate 3,4-dioxygenase subunit alpha [Thioclava sp. NG1]|uniref:protocatechuate 3,4-dioxygenase subunit alpha n=1 Tax=Thioclava TaxID=285107 RepID=UPI000B0F68DE|nr:MULTISPECIES: protocatechuate 3,4-dioxygenase subunit alpha [Thioclava]PWE50821.1 protocatechuate 3,4-dioxygenase subunit alpha [Thioclava sp. NG1]